jgi:hypothetical protein
MNCLIVTEKTKRRIIQNNLLVHALNSYKKNGTLNCNQAKTTYELYLNLQAKLQGLPSGSIKHFNYQPIIEINNETCDICGFPVTKHLTRHHIIPRSKGGKDTIRLCPTCHCAIHKSVDLGDIDYDFVNHLSETKGAVEKFGMYVRLCVEA